MGGSGGGFPTSRTDIERLQREVREANAEIQRDSEVNALLASKLGVINDRDVEKISNALEDIQQALGADFDIAQLLFGGSVSKHTFVDGLSDVDSLVVLDGADIGGMTPDQVRDAFAEKLRAQNLEGVEKVDSGLLAVTVTYKDGTEIQLLPAIRDGDKISIASPDAQSWSSTDPRAFADALRDANKHQRGAVIPAIKLAKAVIGNLPDEHRLAGYHVEALAIAAFRDYDGPRDQKSMVTHFFESASQNITSPIKDVTGQSPFVDERLGARDSPERKSFAAGLRRIAERMKGPGGAAEWKRLLGE